MRDVFGEIDPDEIELIDLIDFDPDAFGSVPQPSEIPADGFRPADGRYRRRRMIANSIATLGLVAAGLLWWSPWHEGLAIELTIVLPDGAAPELTLTDKLVFGDPPAPLTGASLGTNASDAGLEENEGKGYVFAEPGAFADVNGRSRGSWAVFFARAAGSEVAPDLEVGDGQTRGVVQGAPAVTSLSPGTFFWVDFGPVDGWIFTVSTASMSPTESLAFAEAVGINDGSPVLSDPRALGAMKPLGDMADYAIATSTVFEAASAVGGQRDLVSVRYGDPDSGVPGNGAPQYSLASQPVVGQSTLAMVRFFLNGEEGHSVHGRSAIVADAATSGLAFATGRSGSLVAWVEGGRLIVVIGPDDVAATLALAESVRPATTDEWAEVAAVVAEPFPPLEQLDSEPLAGGATLYTEVDPATGDSFSLSAEITDDQLYMCIEVRSTDGSNGTCGGNPNDTVELPLLWAGNLEGRRLVLAVVDAAVADEPQLLITLADGTIETNPLEDVGPSLPGPAVATVLPADHGPVELWNGGVVVASI